MLAFGTSLLIQTLSLPVVYNLDNVTDASKMVLRETTRHANRI